MVQLVTPHTDNDKELAYRCTVAACIKGCNLEDHFTYLLVTMKLLQLVVILTLLLCLMEAANIHSKAEGNGMPISNEDAKGMDKGKESYNRAYEGENEEAVTSVETQALKEERKRDDKSKDMHTVTKRSTSNITVSNCYKTITGFLRPFYIQIVGSEVFLTEYGTQYVHVLDVHTGSTLRKFAIPVGHPPTGLFVKGNRVLVTNYKRETYSFSLNGALFGVHYSYKPVGVAVDYNGLMYTTEFSTGKINVFNIDGTKSHVISIAKSAHLRKIQFDKQGNLYVSGHHNKAVFVFNRHGSLIRSISVPSAPLVDGIHLDPYDETIMYVAERTKGAGKVLKVQIATGKVIKTYSGLSGASDVAVAPDGKLWVVDFEGNSIRIYHEQ